MLRQHLLCLVLFGVASVPAQSISITGKVTEPGGKPVFGAIVTLISKSISDTTGSDGGYSLTGEVSGLKAIYATKGVNGATLHNGRVSFYLSASNDIRVELFDMRGRLLRCTCEKSVPAGMHQVGITGQPSAAGMKLVRISIGQSTTSFIVVPFTDRTSIAPPPGLPVGTSGGSARLMAVNDTLKAAAAGYKISKIAVTSYEGTVNITLQPEDVGTCTASKTANVNVSGTGPHKVTVETNSDPGIKEGTIYRPADLGGNEKYPIFAWGEGGCSQNGKSNSTAMAEIASHGYFVIADGTPGGSGSRSMNSSDPASMGKPLLAYIEWAIAENRKPCSAYYNCLDTTKIATNGFSCGGLMAEGTAGDKRITTWGLNSSGLLNPNQAYYKTVHTPVLMVEGGPSDMAYENGLRDFDGIAALGIPILFFSKDIGHGGDLSKANGGDFTKIDLAWLNWWLKGDEGATGKGALVGSGCKYCSDASWEVKSKNLP